MRCASCSAQVEDSARFCKECGASLARACRSCGTSNRLDARFCTQCGTPMEEQRVSSTLPYAERRQLTVLFGDLVSSSSLSEQIDPEDLRTILHDYQSGCARIIDQYGGHLAKYLDNGILAYFGYPVAHEDDALRGIRSGLSVLKEMKDLAERHRDLTELDFSVRIGIHTGLVVVGDMDEEKVLESDAIVGRTPNMAARIQAAAEPGTLLVSADTHHLIDGYFDAVDRGLHELKGFSEPVQLYQILEESSPRSRLEAIESHMTPFTGRGEEVERLRSRWKMAADGEAQIALVGGEPGVGKSRLLLALKEWVSKEEETAIIELRCSPFYDNSALHPAIDYIERSALQLEREEESEARLTKIEEFLAGYTLSDDTAVQLLASLLMVPLDDRYSPLEMTPQRQKEETIELLVQILLQRSEENPLLLVLEDLHWADPSTLQLFDRILMRSADQKVLILLTYRPEFTPYWQSQPNMVRIELEGMPRGEGEEILRKTVGDRELPGEAVRYILEKTDGIPLFLEELTKMMVDSGMLIEEGEGYVLSAPLETLPVPATLKDSLTARLDRLPEAKPVAQLGATLGREFSYEMMDAIPGIHHNHLEENLQRLTDAGLLFRKGHPPMARYLFKHALIQDSAYSSLLRTSRRTYHTRIAETFEKRFPEIVESQPELLAHHYTKSEEPMKGVGYWLQAGYKALGSSAFEEAISHLRNGIALFDTPPNDPERSFLYVSLKMMLGSAILARQGFVEELEGIYRDAIENAAANNSPQTAIATSCLHSYYYGSSRLDRALETAHRFLEISKQTDDTAGECFANENIGVTHYFAGRFAEAIPHFERTIELKPLCDPQRYGDYVMSTFHDAYQYALTMGSWSQLELGNIARGEEMCDLALEMGRNHPNNYIKINGIFMRGAFALFNEEYDLAESLAVESIQLAEEHIIYWWIGPSTMMLAYIKAVTGDPETGYQMALSVLDIVRGAISLPHQLARFGQICALLQKYDEAIAANDEAIEYIDRTGERWWEAEVYRVRGEFFLGKGEREEALAAFSKALEVARQQEARILQVRAFLSLLDLHAGESETTSGLLAELAELCTTFEGEEHPDLERARRLVKTR